MNNKKKVIIAGSIGLALILIIGVTYAWLTQVLSSTKVNKIVVGGLSLVLDDEASNGINITNGLPQTDEQGLSGNAYTFSVENNGSSNAKYNIYLEDEELESGETRMSDSNVKYYLVKNSEESEPKLLSTVVKDNKRVLDEDIIIEPRETNNYSLKLWIDQESTQEEVGGKVFKAKIKLEAIQTEESKTPSAILFNNETSWGDIITAVKNNNVADFNVGDTKEIDMGTLGKYTIRIANLSTPSECATVGFSQTACGFVLEFVDILDTRGMNNDDTNAGGWPATAMRTYLNNQVYNSMPNDLKENIIDTYSVSGHNDWEGNNFTSTDKVYLLATNEVWGANRDTEWCFSDTAINSTRQLDYYHDNYMADKNNYDIYMKKKDGVEISWWLRSSRSYQDMAFFTVNTHGMCGGGHAWDNYRGVSPAFRIG